MRTIVGIACVVGWLSGPAAVCAGDRDKALAVIEQAIKAHGGAEALTKAQMRSRSGKGVASIGGVGDTPFTTEEIVRLPDRSRMVLEVGRNRLTEVLNGDKGWLLSGGATREMTKEFLAERREELYVWWLMTLTPLRKDGFDLTPLPDAKVNGQDAAVVKVSSKGYPDASLFFDKKTGLLIKIARRATQAGLTFNKEYHYSEHKDCDGAKLPTREITTLNGKKESEARFTACKLLSKVEDSTFNRP